MITPEISPIQGETILTLQELKLQAHHPQPLCALYPFPCIYLEVNEAFPGHLSPAHPTQTGTWGVHMDLCWPRTSSPSSAHFGLAKLRDHSAEVQKLQLLGSCSRKAVPGFSQRLNTPSTFLALRQQSTTNPGSTLGHSGLSLPDPTAAGTNPSRPACCYMPVVNA